MLSYPIYNPWDKPVFPEGVRYWVFWDGSSAQQAQVSVSCVAAV